MMKAAAAAAEMFVMILVFMEALAHLWGAEAATALEVYILPLQLLNQQQQQQQ